MSLNAHRVQGRGPAAPIPGAWLQVVVLAVAASAAACGGSPTRPTPPPTLVLTCPADVQVTSPDGNPTAVAFSPQLTGGSGTLTQTCVPESGSLFPIGTTRVSCTARDAASQVATCQFSIAVAQPPRLRYTKFMAFGDSITEGTVSPAPTLLVLDPAAAYPTKLQQMLRTRYTAQTVTVVNEGKGGEYAQSALSRLQSALDTWRPEVVLLAEGTNDLNAGLTSAINPTAAAMEDMTRAIISSGAIAVVGTIPPMREGGPKAACPSCVEPYNARVVLLTSGKGAKIEDIYPLLNADMQTLIGADGIHPTAAGYDVMATAYFNSIVSWFETQPAGATPVSVPFLHAARH